MAESKEDPKGPRKKPGAPSESLKLETTFEDAVARILRAPVPPGGVPDREPTRKRRGSPGKDSQG